MSPTADHPEAQLAITSFVLGPAQTNVYLIGDTATKTALIIDPGWQGETIAAEASSRGWRITEIALTHAHFDHIAGVADLINALPAPVPIGMHTADEFIRTSSGGARFFGLSSFDPGPKPDIEYESGMKITLNEHTFEVRHTPGHSPGHVVFVVREAGVVFCGDLIFQRSVGRTDLPGGNSKTLLDSIRREILTLPDETRLLPGHGPPSTVGEERRYNPFLSGDFEF